MASVTITCKKCKHIEENTTNAKCVMCDSMNTELEWDERGDYERECEEREAGEDCLPL